MTTASVGGKGAGTTPADTRGIARETRTRPRPPGGSVMLRRSLPPPGCWRSGN